jgi:hypothetical protein
MIPASLNPIILGAATGEEPPAPIEPMEITGYSFAQTTTTALTLTIDVPVGTEVGSLLIAFVTITNGGYLPGEISGWKRLAFSTTGRLIYYTYYDGNYSNTTFTWVNALLHCSITMVAISNAYMDVIGTISGSSNPIAAPSINVTYNNSFLFLFGSTNTEAGRTFTLPAGFNTIYADSDGTAPSTNLSVKSNVSSGATGTATTTAVPNTNIRAVLLSVKQKTSSATYLESIGQRVTGTTNTIRKPAGAVLGNMLVCFWMSNTQNITPTFPTGFTQIAFDNTGVNSAAVAIKYATSSEPDTYTITSSSGGCTVQLVTVGRGFSTVAGSYGEYTNSLVITAPSINAGDGCLFAWFGIEGSPAATPAVSGMIYINGTGGSSGPSLLLFAANDIVAGATGDKTLPPNVAVTSKNIQIGIS